MIIVTYKVQDYLLVMEYIIQRLNIAIIILLEYLRQLIILPINKMIKILVHY